MGHHKKDVDTHASRRDRRDGDRRGRVKPRLPERRSGFDRRTPLSRAAAWLHDALIALRERPLTLAAILLACNALSLADLGLTFIALERGATEGNPVIAALLSTDPLLAAWTKTGIMAAVTLSAWAMRRYRRALEFALFALAVYTALIGYHVVGLATLRTG